MTDGSWRFPPIERLARGPATLEGHPFHFSGAPNRYRLPAFYALHVWAWKHNPKGTFVNWNPLVSCN